MSSIMKGPMKRQRIGIIVLLLLVAALITACGGDRPAQSIGEVVQEMAAQGATAQTPGSSDASGPGDAIATVNVRSLRVRAAPSSQATVVTGIKEGEQYAVLGLSSDGEWVQLAIPAAPEGRGWVSTNFVSVEGSIAGAAVIDVPPAAAVSTASVFPTATPDTSSVTAPDSPLYPPGAPGTATVNTEGVRLRVRTAPAADAAIAGYIYGGENYPVVETSPDGAWVRIDGRSGTDNLDGGWVSTEFLLLY
jgi:uncharacterized protein YgiM (DUF1202 family)